MQRLRKRIALALAVLVTSMPAWPDTDPTAAPASQEVVPGVWLIPGGIRPNRQPDGNSVILEAPDGLIVVDTGRHAWQRAAILSLARTQKKKIVAIVNTHWHLDHVSGNPDLRAAYPDLLVYASDAIDGALAGFFPASARDSARYLEDPEVPEAMREDIRGDLLTLRDGAALRPDKVIAASGEMNIGGRLLQLHLARDAATAGDVWLYDERNRVAVVGDLVTLPAPFLDTACPGGWQSALNQVAAIDFAVAIPGHGPPLDRPRFLLYRDAFDAFVKCSRSTRADESCASDWVDAIRPLLADDPLERQRARRMAAYYVGMLRANGGRSKYCVPRD